MTIGTEQAATSRPNAFKTNTRGKESRRWSLCGSTATTERNGSTNIVMDATDARTGSQKAAKGAQCTGRTSTEARFQNLQTPPGQFIGTKEVTGTHTAIMVIIIRD